MPVASVPELDLDAVRKLAAGLGVSLPITIIWRQPEDDTTAGTQRLVEGVEHVITLYLHEGENRLDLNRTLIHELQHCADIETAEDQAAYWRDPELFEQRARETMFRLALRVDLVKPSGTAANKPQITP